jgi:hypothetical protein
MRYVVHGEIRSAYNILPGKPQGKISLLGPTKMDLKERNGL